jgi:hypothetical protein
MDLVCNAKPSMGKRTPLERDTRTESGTQAVKEIKDAQYKNNRYVIQPHLAFADAGWSRDW